VGADIAVVAWLHALLIMPDMPPQVLCTAKSGERGKFQMSVPVPPPYQCAALKLLVMHGGHGVGVKTLDLVDRRQDCTVRLRAGRTIRGRVLDTAGRPVPGLRVHLVGVPDDANGTYFPSRVPAPAAWPTAATADREGRFTFANIPVDATALTFDIPDERVAPGVLTRNLPKTDEELGLGLLEPRLVEGTVVRGDSGEPLPNAWLLVVLGGGSIPGDLQHEGVQAKTDARGKFQARCRPGDFLTIYAYPPFGEPYPSWVDRGGRWPKGATPQEVRVAVPRGILVRGQVVDGEAGTGVADAGVEYMIRQQKNPYLGEDTCHQLYWGAEYRRALTEADGSFEIAVMPGPGALLVRAATPDFVGQLVTWGELQFEKEKGGHFACVDGLLRIDPKPKPESLSVRIALRRGVTISGRLVGPRGEEIRSAIALHSHYGLDFYPRHQPTDVRNGRFELRGCDPKAPARVYFLDSEHGWGASAEIEPGKAQTEPTTIRLAPCGSATVRFVDSENRAWGNLAICSTRPPFMFPKLVTAVYVPLKGEKYFVSPHLGLDPRYLKGRPYDGLRTDADGRVTFPGLIPGAPYKLQVEGVPLGANCQDKQDFTVGAGECVRLPDITVERPKPRPR
jgi:protocatechuate 3,4-dioxygenase beta subunit